MSLPRVGISRCLLGEAVRYDGGHKRNHVILSAFDALVEWVPVCPEVETGMTTPREPIELTAGSDGVRVIGQITGIDWTEPLATFASRRVAELEGLELSGYVLKSRSPSCGLEGPGLFARALLAAMPGLPIEDERRLQDEAVRQRFLSRVLAYRG
ncbi:MAG: DUF523 domain-containing protein [Vicinamibacterales bacterium]